MRTSVWLRIGAIFGAIALPLTAQTPSAAVQEFLRLEPGQVASIAERNARLMQAIAENRAAEAAAAAGVEAATAQATPEAAELGRLHVDLETRRRAARQLTSDAIVDQQALLTPAQRPQLDALDQVLANVGNACAASNLLLMPRIVVGVLLSQPLPASSWVEAPAFRGGVCPGGEMPVVPAALREALDLTSAQESAIVGEAREYQRFSAEQNRLLADLARQIQEATQSPSPDALTLGSLHQKRREAERAIESRRRVAEDANRTTLTVPQRLRVDDLAAALTVRPTACDAVASHLLADRPLPALEVRSGDFTYVFPDALPPVPPAPGSVCQPANVPANRLSPTQP